MKLSTPIYHLKRKARLLSRKQNIPLHQALDLIAGNEGFSGWSLLAAKAPSPVSARELFATLNPGGLVLIGARPGQGKTLLSLELAVEAMKIGNRSAFFTLEYTEYDVTDRLRVIDRAWERFRGFFDFDSSDDISSDYIIEKLASAKSRKSIILRSGNEAVSGFGDVRLPNPLDLTLFDKTYFLQGRNPFRVAGLADLNKKPGRHL